MGQAHPGICGRIVRLFMYVPWMRRRHAWCAAHGSLLLALIATLLLPQGHGAAATGFANTAFASQWQTVEAVTPNFWGPLANATSGLNEPYADASGGKRLVQYFDKARMELGASNRVTYGLLTVELKSGRVQTGNTTFDQRTPATIGVASDPGQSGPTYADLAKLAEKSPRTQGAKLTTMYMNGQFPQSTAVPTDPLLALTQYVSDPNGRYGQYVPKAFMDYFATLPLPWQSVLGVPISPAFGAHLVVGGATHLVYIQAFERRVLTYTPDNPVAYRVEFANIGQHYYQWRYGTNAPEPAPTPTTATDPNPMANTNTSTTTQGSPVNHAVPSLNWSGYAADGSNITAVHGTWTVPPVAPSPSTGYVAMWVGIGGTSSDTLIQAGTEADIEEGDISYYAWVEALPDTALGVSPHRLPVSPGDVFSVTIATTDDTNWTATLEDHTNGQHLTLSTQYDSCECSAEWITEVPAVDGNSKAPLANFGSVHFTEATATVNGAIQSAAALHPSPVALRIGGKTRAVPTTLESDGQSFTVSYQP